MNPAAVEEPAAPPTAASRHYVLALMALVAASQIADRQLLSIVMEPVKADLGLTDTQMGFLNGTVFGVAYALGALPFALLADRWSRKKVIATTLAFWSAMTALTATATSYAGLVVSRALVGFGEAGAGPAMLALLSRHYPPAQRAGMVGMLTSITALTAFLVFWGAGHAVERFGWRSLFLILGIPGIVLAAVIWFTVADAAPNRPVQRARTDWTDVRRALLQVSMVHLIATAAWNGIILSGLGAWTPAYLMRTFQMGFADVGFWLGAAGIASGVVGALAGGLWSGRLMARDPLGGLRLARWVLWFNLPLSLAVYAAPSLPATLGLMLLSAVVVGMVGPPVAAQLLAWMPERSRATAMAIVSMGVLFVSGLGATLAGTASDALAAAGHANGLRSALLLVAGLGVFPLLHLSALLRNRSAGVIDQPGAA